MSNKHRSSKESPAPIAGKPTSATDPKTAQVFSTDRPRRSLDEDELGRKDFARSIAQAIRTWQGDEGLVMALYGQWGDGKSSVKGMVLDALRANDNECPIIVDFNPWEWSGQNQLSQVFFEEIGKQIGHQKAANDSTKALECGNRLRKLGKYLHMAGALMTPVGYAANLAFPFASLVTDAAAKALGKSAELAEKSAEATDYQRDQEATSLPTIKAELKDALKELGSNVLVLIDDVDRLAADEIRLIFQLIKANSDFPNLVFFLFFQRDVVERGLEETIKTGSGRDFLGKIVQVPLSLPLIQPGLLDKFLASRLNGVLERRGLDARFQEDRFRDLWRNGMSTFFKNPRDVVRLLGTYEFHAASFPGPTEFDPVDLFAVEVFRIFDEPVYQRMGISQDLAEFDFLTAKLEGKEDDHYLAVINRVAGGPAGRIDTPARNMLLKLFPRETYAVDQGRDEVLKLQRESRICHPIYFSRYFNLCVPEGDIPQERIAELLDATSDVDRFRLIFDELDKQRLALEALRRLKAHHESFQANNAYSLGMALCEIGDRLAGRYSKDSWVGLPDVICDILEAHVRREPDLPSRFAQLLRLLRETRSVGIPMRLTARAGGALQRSTQVDAPAKTSHNFLIASSEAELELLRNACVRLFKTAAQAGELDRYPLLARVLECWRRWESDPTSVRDFVLKLLATPSSLEFFLEQMIGDAVTANAPIIFGEFEFDHLKSMEFLVPGAKLAQAVATLRTQVSEPRGIKLCDYFDRLWKEKTHRTTQMPEEPLEPPSTETHDGDDPPDPKSPG